MRSSRSLLEQLDKKGILFYNSAVPYDKTATFQTPCLTSMEISTKGHTKYKAPLDSRTMNKICFIKWWDQDIIYKDKSGNIFTRKELVRNVTDCDGGTHIGPNLKEAYANLSRLNLTRLRVVTNKGKGFFVNSPVLPSIRQIAYELLKTLEDEFPDLF